VAQPKGRSTGISSLTEIVPHLAVPAGSYVVTAKAVAGNANDLPVYATCQLDSSPRVDEGRYARDSSSAIVPGLTEIGGHQWYGGDETLALHATADLPDGGAFWIACGSAGGTAWVSEASVSAIRVATLTNG
jgi:hypothetical protein